MRYQTEIIEPLAKEAGQDIGFMVFFEEGDNLFDDNEAAHLSKVNRGIYFDYFENGNCWEAVEDHGNMFEVLALMNNEYGVTYFIPKEEWVDKDLIEMLKHEARNVNISTEEEDADQT